MFGAASVCSPCRARVFVLALCVGCACKHHALPRAAAAQIWDQIFGSMYTGTQVISAMAARKQGLRTKAAYAKVPKPDYSPLLKLGFYTSAPLLNGGHAGEKASEEKAA